MKSQQVVLEAINKVDIVLRNSTQTYTMQFTTQKESNPGTNPDRSTFTYI